GDMSKPINGATSATLDTGKLQGVSQASFWVRVSNPAGSIDSDTMSITLTPIPPVLNAPAEAKGPIKVVEFSKTSLEIEAYGSGSLSYQWYRGESGDMSNPIDGATAATLLEMQMLGVGEQHFWVQVTNATGATNSETMVVDVQPSPPFIVELSDNLSVPEH